MSELPILIFAALIIIPAIALQMLFVAAAVLLMDRGAKAHR